MIPVLLILAVEPSAIEQFYNKARTLTAEFEQKYRNGQHARTEAGTLTLRKPGRMRWDYDNGKIFVTDGKKVWFYQPSANRAEYSKVKESEDLRAPLAFLLGRLDFKKLFKDVRNENGEIVAIPKSENAPYREVRFRAGADGTIETVQVTGQDASEMTFIFRDQQRNIKVDDEMFKFVPPAGAEVVEAESNP